MTFRKLLGLAAATLLLAAGSAVAQAPAPHVFPSLAPAKCDGTDRSRPQRNPTPGELRCRYGVGGPGRFGLISYADFPVYQPATPLPGNHVVGVPGMPRPRPGESYEAWEWRVLRTEFGPEARRVHRSLEVLDPRFAERILRLERLLAEAGVRFARRETWRAPERQAFLFQQGRSRPGPFATSTLTSWHTRVNALGRPAGRAVDYEVPAAYLRRFHEVVQEVGLEGYGADSNDPGHVFLPGDESLPGLEVALLRLLPRVPAVTLATGRPDNESHSRDALREIHELARSFVVEPFVAVPRLQTVLSLFGAPKVMAPTVAAAPAPAPAPAPRTRRRFGLR
jgi:hypothetical protein